MNENKTSNEKPTVRSSGTLSLGNRASLNTVKQSFSHGRTNSVVVERKRRRVNVPGAAPAGVPSQDEKSPPQTSQAASEAIKKQVSAPPVDEAETKTSLTADKLTSAQQEARARALQEAKVRAVEENERLAIEAEQQAKEAARRELEDAERQRREAEEKAEQEAKLLAEERAASRTKAPESRSADKTSQTDETRNALRSGKTKTVDPKPVKRDNERRQTRLTITKALNSDDERDRSLASFRRRVQREKRRAQGDSDRPQQKISRQVTVPETITLQELANRMAERVSDVIKFLFNQGQVHVATDFIDADTAQLVAEEMGHTVKRVAEADVEEGFISSVDDDESQLKPRPPVVTVMGHVDHGKTSLLDAIRNADVVSGEAGGITQHIGAYQVTTPTNQVITFLDTPGHAVFTSMRARGAETTDIVVLVVAADDGVKPQTIEAINHAKAANAPMIVAINKIDRPGANPNTVRTDLLQHSVQVESMGGDILEIEVSALKQTNIDKLLEAINLQAELLELKANPNRSAEGAVIESRMEKGRGSVSTVLIKRGTLRTGDLIVAGGAWGKVRALFNDRGEQIKAAGPSMPVEVLGLTGTPGAGESIALVESEQRAREITAYRERRERELAMAKTSNRVSFEQMLARKDGSETKLFSVLIKADTFGSIEAIAGALEKLGNDEVKVQIVHSGVGGINESDIILARTTEAAIVGFNVRANRQATDLASKEAVEIRYYNIIYNMVDDVKLALEGLLKPELRETWLGTAEILEVFSISKVGKVAGCRSLDGTIERGAHVRLIRDDIVIHEGKLSTLKRFKDEVKEVQPGQECGMGFENYQDIKQGDKIECYRVEETQRKLD